MTAAAPERPTTTYRTYHRIVVEGIDGSGKTTLIQQLQDKFHYLKLIRNEKGPEQDFNSWWYEVLKPSDSLYVPIHDRFFYSELIYGPIIRGRIAAVPEVIKTTRDILRSYALLIYARPDIDAIRAGILSNNQMEGVNEKFWELLEAYDHAMMAESHFYEHRMLIYNWRTPGALQWIEHKVEMYLG